MGARIAASPERRNLQGKHKLDSCVDIPQGFGGQATYLLGQHPLIERNQL